MLSEHPYLALYLLGCGLVVGLTLVNIALHWAIAWITKANVAVANLRKLEPSEKTPFLVKVGKFIGTIALEALLSWINVVVILWKIVTLLLRATREVFSSAPESIQRLRFPLKNNPELPVESVWAYTVALGIKAGAPPPDENGLAKQLDDVCDNVPRFDRKAALRQLEALEVVKPSVINAVAAMATDLD